MEHPLIYKEFISHNPTQPEIQFALHWVELYPDIDLHFQYPLSKNKRSKFDYAHVPTRVGIDIHGGTRVSGMGHSSGSGIKKDAQKSRRAAEEGWMYVVLTSEEVSDSRKLAEIYRIISNRLSEMNT